MDREKAPTGECRQEEGREEAVCQGRRAALFLLPSPTQDLIESRQKSHEWPGGSK